ncbi:hypothetical protein BS17DRAFT_271003 [Gyrodon lividus]|nr:hypothetical protein BS17DRAFT_271003 [Gyrodon lividus]
MITKDDGTIIVKQGGRELLIGTISVKGCQCYVSSLVLSWNSRIFRSYGGGRVCGNS